MAKVFQCDDESRREQVEKYLLGGMRKKEQAAFEDHFAHCDACYEQLLESQKILTDLKDAARKAGWENKDIDKLTYLFGRKGFFADFNWRLVLVISAVLFFVGVLPFVWWANKAETRMRIMVALEPETELDEGAADKNGILQQALLLQGRGDYDEAIEKLSNAGKLLEQAPTKVNAQRLIGLSYLLKRKPEQALPHLQLALVDAKPAAEIKAMWYIGNAHLLLGNKKIAVSYLNKVLADSGPLRREASKLLEKLQKIPDE